jgi:capsular polysaccharide transport system ATP-binding protein
MRARFEFALSLAIDFDCYLIDEIIAAGDQRFHRRSHEEPFEKRADRSLKHAGFDASNCGVPQNRRTRGDTREIRYIYS